MIKIYHNPRCRKSREGLEILEQSGKKFEVIKYLDDVPTPSDLKKIIDLMGIKPIDLIRKNEAVWKEKFKDLSLSDKELLEAMATYPKLIERPIVVKESRAVIGRPPSNIAALIA